MSSTPSPKESTPNKSSPSRSPAKKSVESASKEKEAGAEIYRQYSEQSDKTLQQLDELDSYFASFASRVENIDKSIDMGDRRTLLAAKHELAQIIGDLENLQFKQVPSCLCLMLNEN